MNGFTAIFQRELNAYFATPLAYVFLFIFLVLSGVFTFYLGSFYERGQADLNSFFQFHPWLYLFLVPAISMRLWAEERKTGTLELLLTLPLSAMASIVGKFAAAWVFIAIALLMTFPIVLSVNYLGEPDNGVIIAGYVGSWLMAGGYLAIGSCVSAATKNQVIAFVVTALVCFLFLVSGLPIVLDWLPDIFGSLLLNTIASFSVLNHFEAISKGVIALRDLVYFFSLIVVWLYATGVVLDMRKAA